MLPDTFIPQSKTTSEAQCSQNENDEDSDGKFSLDEIFLNLLYQLIYTEH